MSSNWSRKNYDDCNYKEKLNMSITAGNYHSNLNSYENNLGINTKLYPCNQNMKKNKNCKVCDVNKNAKYNNDFNTKTNELLDIETDLKNYTKKNNCKLNKNDNDNLINFDNYDTSLSVVTPHLCNREIVPSNMKMPTNNGLKY